MRFNAWLAACAALLVTVAAGAADAKKSAGAIKANGSIELTDPAGDVSPIHSSDGVDYPGFDIIKLSLKSDGKQIVVVATLKDPPGAFASEVAEFHFDTDNNPKSGVQFVYPHIGGFEYDGELNACVDYEDRSSACAGGSNVKPTAHWAAVKLSRYKGKNEYDRETIVDPLGFPGSKESAKTPITGNVVQGSFEYRDLKVKSGQTIRLMVKESHGNDENGGYFPEILLKLK